MGHGTGAGSTVARSKVMVNGALIVDRRDPMRHHAVRQVRRERRSIHGDGVHPGGAPSDGRASLRLVPPLVDQSERPSMPASAVQLPSPAARHDARPATAFDTPSRSRRAAKRTFDLGVALVLAALTLPIVLLLLVGSAVAYRANPVFVQRRVGLGGREFRFVKIRSLPQTTPTYTDKYHLASIPNNQWGQALRRLKLDELPQLWHVVFGRMSLIGPRPEMPGLSASFDRTFVDRRLTVKPGCSGLWQISPDNSKLIGEAPQWDLHYVRNWTLRLDLWVMVATLASVPGWMSLQSLGGIPRWTGAAPAGRQSDAFDPSASVVTGATEAEATRGITVMAGAGH